MKNGPLHLDDRYPAHALDPTITPTPGSFDAGALPANRKGPGLVPAPDPGPALMTGAVGLPKAKKGKR